MGKIVTNKFLPESILQYDRIALGGLGGGADIVSVMPLYMYLLSLGKQVTLISCHGRTMEFLKGGTRITKYSKWVDDKCTRGTGDRVFEHILYREIENQIKPLNLPGYQKPQIAFVSRHAAPEGVARAFDIIAHENDLQAILLLDGGGDALECNTHNTRGTSHKGDSLVIEALTETYKIPTYVGIVACGIDTPSNWKKVIQEIKDLGGYEGIFDLKHMNKNILEPALQVMRSCVKMTSKDSSDLSPSLTCTTFWCALLKHYKVIATQAHWMPTIEVVPEYSKLRIFQASVLHQVKCEFRDPDFESFKMYDYNASDDWFNKPKRDRRSKPKPKKEEKPSNHHKAVFNTWLSKYNKRFKGE